MPESRLEVLTSRLEKGRRKTFETLQGLTPEQWQLKLYSDPEWSVYNLLIHFVSTEENLLALAEDIASGGTGAPQGLEIDAFNADEQMRLRGQSIQEFLVALDRARQQTIDWVRTLSDEQLDRVGRHPALGEVNVETIILAAYGHQLLHMRDLARLLSVSG